MEENRGRASRVNRDTVSGILTPLVLTLIAAACFVASVLYSMSAAAR